MIKPLSEGIDCLDDGLDDRGVVKVVGWLSYLLIVVT
jgi:hypothetical protein